jgi:thiol-disulfide isomerase/thioredoxin
MPGTKAQHKIAAMLCGLLYTCAVYAVEVDEQAPAFSLPTLDEPSSTVSLADFRGKVVYVDFWASWCAPCQVSIPLLSELRNSYAAQGLDFEVVAINVDSDPADGTDFLVDVPVEYVVLSDPEGKTPGLYDLKAMPTSYLVDKTGKVRLVHSGFKRSDIDMIADEVQKLLAETP